MGNTWSKETQESWQQEDVKKWMGACMKEQKQWYDGYEGVQFHSFDCSVDGNIELLKAKVCYALFGLPTETDATTLLDGYKPDMQKDAAVFVDKIVELYPLKRLATVELMTLFIYCKSADGESRFPIFRLCIDRAAVKYMDISKRVYKSWQDFLDNNNLPMMKYGYPKHGFYSCSEDEVADYVEDKYPTLVFGNTPACNPTARAASALDVTSMVTSFGSAGIMVAGMFTPIAPVIMVAGGGVGLASALWGTSRSAQRLYDKGQHEESLTDMESMTSWLAIALTPLSVAASASNAYLANGARVSGRIFTPTIRYAVTMLNYTTFGLQSGMLVLGIANLVQKKQKDQLTTLDVLQFSMTLFFFTNTVMQPKTANAIIARAQADHIQQTRGTMTDEAALASFDKYLAQNKGDGGIKDTSAIVRSLNKIDNPNDLFKGLTNADSIKIGGRKGNTLLVSKEGTETMPTRISVRGRTFFTSSQSRPIPAFQRNQIDKALGNYKDTEFGKRVLNVDEMMPHEASTRAAWLDKTLRTTGRNYDAQIIDVAVSIAQELDVQNVGDFCAVLELVSQHAGPRATLGTSLSNLMSTGRTDFLESLTADMERAREIATNAGMVFESALKATYHFRKHGEQFATEESYALDPMTCGRFRRDTSPQRTYAM